MGREHVQEAMQSKKDRTDEDEGDQRERTPDCVPSKHTQLHATF